MEYNKEEYKKKFATDILKAANYINEKACRGVANYIVTSSNLANLILTHKADKRIETINKLLKANEQ